MKGHGEVRLNERAALTPRQRELLELVRSGRSNREIAAALDISEDTVKAHLSRLYARFDVPNRAALVAVTSANGSAERTSAGMSLGRLRSLARDARAESVRHDHDGPPVDLRVIAVRDALAAVDVALDLVSELPPAASGAVVAALRKRIDEAFAALAQLETPQPSA